MIRRAVGIGLALGLAWLPSPSKAATTNGQSRQTAVVEVVVNGIARGPAVVQIDPDGDVWIKRAALEQAGLGKLPRSVGGADPVSLRAFAPALSFEIDPVAVALSIHVAPEYLGNNLVDLTRTRAETPVVRSNSAFLNYRLESSRPIGGEGTSFVSAPVELGINVGPVHLQAAGRYSNAAGQSLSRTAVTALLDQPRQSRRWLLGDHTAAGGRLGGAALIAGVGVQSNFSLRPELVRIPGAAFELELEVPAELDVRVNGATIRTVLLPAGRVRLENLQLPAGTADVELILRDEMGRERRIDALLYGSSRLLRPGTHEYSYSVGVERNERLGLGFDYGDPAGIAFHRAGITNWLTAGARFEARPGLVSGGFSLAMLLGPFGEIEGAVGLSDSAGGRGVAYAVDYRVVRRRVFSVLSARWIGQGYATVSNPGGAAFETLSLRASVGLNLVRSWGVSLDAISDRVAEERSVLYGGRLHGVIGRRLSVDLAVARGTGRREGVQIAATASLVLGPRTSVRIAAEQRSGRVGQRLTLNRSTPVGTGFSYQLDVERNSDNSITDTGGRGSIRYRGRFGELALSYSHRDGRGTVTTSMAGSFTWIAGGLYAARPITTGFALVRVRGMEGVAVRYRNELVGSTSGAGTLFIPELIPYAENRIEVSAADLPLEIEIPQPRRIVATPFRGGGVVDFPVQRFQSFVGRLLLIADSDDPAIDLRAGVPRPAEFGQIAVTVPGESAPRTSIIGRKGLVYLENVPPGEYAATITLRGKVCAFTLTIPATESVRVDLGSIVCRLGEEES